MTRRPVSQRLTAGLLGLGILGAVIAQAAPAAAHSELLESSPRAGAVLDAAPRAVELTFGEDVQTQGGGIVVKGPSGQWYDDPSTFSVDGTVASVGLSPQDGGYVDGTYTVTYRVVSADGHIVSGSYDFQLRGVAQTDKPSPTSTLDASPVGGPPPQEKSGGGVVWVLGLGAIGLVLVAAVISVAVRGRRGR